MRTFTLHKILERTRRDEELLKSRPWAAFFGNLDYDPCADIKRPENITDEIFYKVCFLASQWETWFDDPDSSKLDQAWANIYSLNATGRYGEGLFDLA